MSDWFKVFSAVQAVVLMVAAVLLFTLRAGLKAGRWTQWPAEIDKRFEVVESKFTTIEARLNKGSAEMSKIASDVQSLPERLRREFLAIELSDVLQRESQQDRARLWDDIRRLWEAFERRGPRR